MPSILIVGQGLAGTLLACELEREGMDFKIVDCGHAGAASQVAAGIINPITGQRLVKSWRIDELLPMARDCYQGCENRFGVPLWREMRVHRQFADETERRVFSEKQARRELNPFVASSDDDGFWIQSAAQVDIPRLMASARERWREAGHFYDVPCSALAELRLRYPVVVLCTGAASSNEIGFDFVRWSVAKGELLTVETRGLVSDVILNRGHWVLPMDAESAKIGATYTPDVSDLIPSAVARETLEQSAATLLPWPFTVQTQAAGLRLATPDKHPVIGWSPTEMGLGIMSGLGSKGALLAPWLARQWCEHLRMGKLFDPAVDVNRFWRGATR